VPAGQPPVIQLRFEGALFDGVQGSYCWQARAPMGTAGGPPQPGRCVDRVAPTFESVLAWPAGAAVEFVVTGPAPTELTLAVATRPTDPLALQTTLPPGPSATWQPNLPPGAYVLMVSGRWPEGDAIYYFPIGLLESGTGGAGAEAAGGVPPSAADDGRLAFGVGSLNDGRVEGRFTRLVVTSVE
jgi:hypothetical protein